MYLSLVTPLTRLFQLRIHLRSSFFSTTWRPPSGSKVPKMNSMGPIWVFGFEKNAQHTRYSQPVTHVSTNPARRSFIFNSGNLPTLSKLTFPLLLNSFPVQFKPPRCWENYLENREKMFYLILGTRLSSLYTVLIFNSGNLPDLSKLTFQLLLNNFPVFYELLR